MIKFILSLAVFGSTLVFFVSAADQNCNQFANDLHIGMKSVEVERLNLYLKSKGYSVSTTSEFSIQTASAVRYFQMQNKITPTGYFGPRSRIAVNSKICKAVSVVKRLDANNVSPTTEVSSSTSSAPTGVSTAKSGIVLVQRNGSDIGSSSESFTATSSTLVASRSNQKSEVFRLNTDWQKFWEHPVTPKADMSVPVISSITIFGDTLKVEGENLSRVTGCGAENVSGKILSLTENVQSASGTVICKFEGQELTDSSKSKYLWVQTSTLVRSKTFTRY